MIWLLRTLAAILVAFAAGLPAAALDLQRLSMMTAAEQVPWRGVGRLDITGTFGSAMCTGTLIAEDLVLTAAHCMTNPLTGRPVAPEDVEFTAGLRLGVSYGHSRASKVAVHPRYDGRRSGVGANIPFDLALVRLADPIPRSRAPFFEIAPTPVKAVPLTLISYRADRQSGPTRQDGCTITRISVIEAAATGARGNGGYRAGNAEPTQAGFKRAPVPGSSAPLLTAPIPGMQPAPGHSVLPGVSAPATGVDPSKAQGEVLTLGCEVIFGASGSALFEEVGGKPRIVAVLSAMSRDSGKAVAYAVSVSAAIAAVRGALN